MTLAFNIGRAATDGVPRWQPTLPGTSRLGHLEDDRPAVANDPRTDLHQPLAQRGSFDHCATSAGSARVRMKLARL